MSGAFADGPRGRMLAWAVTLTLLMVLWAICVHPLVRWHIERAERLEQRLALLQHMSELAATLPELQRQSSEGTPVGNLIEGASDALAGASLQGLVQRIAATAGAELDSMETLPPEQRGNYRRIGLRVATTAPWPVLVRLLQETAQGPPRMLVDELQLNAPPFEVRTAMSPINATITIVAFCAATAARVE